MGAKYKNLAELRQQKALLKNEVQDLQDLITFKNPKTSFSELTGGFTDEFLTLKPGDDGEKHLALKTGSIVSQVSRGLQKKISDKNRTPVLRLDNDNLKQSVVENALRLGIVTFVGSYARKKLYNSSWKNKLIGILLVYVAPVAIDRKSVV